MGPGKQKERVAALQRAYRKAVAAHPREHMPSAEQIRNLGVLGKEEDSRAVMEMDKKDAIKSTKK